MADFYERSVIVHEQLRGKIGIVNKIPIESQDDLSTAYTPGVARPCEMIAADPARARDLTIKRNTVAVVSDGSAVLGLGNIGALAALPVMEGKALLFKEYANIDAWPLCLDTQDSDEIVSTVRRIAPVFGGVNLEDIAAPRCFEVENRLQDLGIPVFHDDQHGTAIVLLAALLNAARVLGRELPDMKVVVSGAGAAGTAIARLLRCVNFDPQVCVPVDDIIVCDSQGIIDAQRQRLAPEKQELLGYTNRHQRSGSLRDALEGADVFIGVSKGGCSPPTIFAPWLRDRLSWPWPIPNQRFSLMKPKEVGLRLWARGAATFPTRSTMCWLFPVFFAAPWTPGLAQSTAA